MKAKYLLIGLALACVFGACSRDEESLFDKSASERAQEALDNANEVLVAAANGWEMLYFANTESCGYNVVLKFEENGRVIATAKNDLTTNKKLVTDSTSTWQVKLDYGPIITFDTYNEVIHAWADPRTDGDGYLGDYEFLILHADPNYIKLKGKKHSGYCYLFPMEEGKTVEAYFEEIAAAQNRFFGGSNLVRIAFDNQEYLLHNGGTGIFDFTNLGELPSTEEPEIYPFVVRANGIQCMIAPRTTGDLSFEYKNGALVGEHSRIFAAAPADYIPEFINLLSGGWALDIENICDSGKTVIADINAKLKAAYPKNKSKAGLSGLTIKKTSKGLVVALSYIGGSKTAVEISYLFEVSKENNDIKLTNNGPADDNAQKTVNAFPSMGVLIDMLNGTFAPVAEEPLNPSIGTRLTNKSNSELWCNITGKF